MNGTHDQDCYSKRDTLFKALALLQKDFLETLDFREAFREVLGLVQHVTGSPMGFIGETVIDEGQRSCVRIQAISNIAWNPEARALHKQLEAGDFLLHAPDSLIGATLCSNKPVVCNDPASDERSGGVPDGHPAIESFLGIPLLRSGVAIGVIGLANRAGGYDEAIVSALDPILPICAALVHSRIQSAAREKSERALQASEGRFRALFASISQGVVHYAADGRVIALNPAAEAIFGGGLAQAPGFGRFGSAEKMIREDGSPLPPSEIPTVQVLRAERRLGPVVLGWQEPGSGGTSWFSVEATPLFRDSGATPVEAYAVFGDITREKETELALRESERLYRLAQAASGVGVWDWHVQEDQLFWDSSCWEMLGEVPQDRILCFRDWSARVQPDDMARIEDEIQSKIAGREEFSVEFRLRTADGDWLWVNGRGRAVEHDGEGRVTRVMGTHTNIQLRKEAELAFQAEHEALLHSNQELRLLAKVFTHASEGIVITDPDGRIINANAAFSRITGYPLDELIGRNPRMLHSGDQSAEFYAELWRSLGKRGHWSGELWNRRRDGTRYCQELTISVVADEAGDTRYYVGWVRDISAEKEHQRKLEFIANYDGLTSLPNRNLLSTNLKKAMVEAKRSGHIVGVAYVDLDGFKEVNDNLGHDAGDALLKLVADRMKSCLRSHDTVARFGGDEFVVVLTSLDDPSGAVPIIQRLLGATDVSWGPGESVSRVSASIGVTFYHPSSSEEPDQLLRYADQAMYQAKLMGKNGYHVFDPVQDNALRDRHSMFKRVEAGLEAGEFVLYYQPKVNMRSGEVVGLEGLIRWNHPEDGVLPPASFLPEVESTPTGTRICDWVIGTALAQMNVWQKEGLSLPVSVNVSAYDLQREEFVDRLQALLNEYPDVPAGHLSLEVLETGAIGDMERVGGVISACSTLGVGFALDDFGTGYSSLAHLRRLPAQTLKVDRSFVHDMLVDADDLMILEGVMGLASAFRRKTIAEGVETVAHGEMLLDLGCDVAQGYAISRPLPVREVRPWLAAWQPYPAWNERVPLSSRWIPVLVGAVYHRAWMLEALDYLNTGGRRRLQPYDACRFGAWLREDAGALIPARKELEEIELAHARVHELAEILIDMGDHSNPDIRKKKMNRFLRGSDHLLALLGRVLKREIYGEADACKIGYLDVAMPAVNEPMRIESPGHRETRAS